MSSPARSSASAASGGTQSGTFPGDDGPYHFPTDLILPHDRKDEAVAVLKAELMAALQKEVKSLDDDNWMFSRPRSQIHLISKSGDYLRKLGGKPEM